MDHYKGCHHIGLFSKHFQTHTRLGKRIPVTCANVIISDEGWDSVGGQYYRGKYHTPLSARAINW